MTMKATVTLTITVAEEVTEDQFTEFIRFNVGENGGIDLGNPLSGYDLLSCEVEVVSIKF